MEKPIEDDFKRLYSDHADGIWRLFYFKIHNRERAKELMQETFLKLWETLQKGTPVEKMKSYAYRIAHNLMVNEVARRKEHHSLELLQEETGYEPTAPEPLPDRSSESRELLDKLHQLEWKYCEILTMRYIEELSIKEIAGIMGENENVISVRIHRALEKLKNKYEKQ
jgi:RNA polymerase sigma-70 factor, ECF subfamily